MASAEAARDGGGSATKRAGNGVDDPADPAETAAAEQQKETAEHVQPTQSTTSRSLRFFFLSQTQNEEEKRVRDGLTEENQEKNLF